MAFLLLGIILQIAGVIHFVEPKQEEVDALLVTPTAPVVPDEPVVDHEAERVQAEVARYFERAEQATQAGNYGSTISHLIRARRVDPDNRDIACRLVDAYTSAGRDEEAAEARNRCRGR